MVSPNNVGKKKSGDFCSAINCRNAKGKESCKGISFFLFPWKDEERCRKWIQNMRRQDIMAIPMIEIKRKGLRLCAEHFEPSQFNVLVERKRLVWNAIPTIFDVPNPPATGTLKRKRVERKVADAPPPKQMNLDNDLKDEASHSVSQSQTSRAEAELRQKLKSTRNSLYRLKKFKHNLTAGNIENNEDPVELFDSISKLLPAPTADFFKTQVLMCNREKKGRRWSDEEKAVALSLYHASPKCYGLLQKLFTLTSIFTLKRSVQNINIYPGFNGRIFICLGDKLKNMPENSRLCSVVFDEMNIKENLSYNANRDEIEGFEDFGLYGEKTKLPVNHATVFMARGLVSNWKQPLGYFLSNGPIKNNMLSTLITSCVIHLTAVALDVKFVVGDQGSNNRKAFSSLGVSELSPFFFVDGKKILVFYDPPHLLKNVRNNLKRSGFQTDSGTVDWKHIVDFYNIDRQNSVRMVPKLTDVHLNLPPFSTFKVSYAAQILSHSVAAGISFIGRLRNDESASETSKFMENFDCLFNAFNSRNLRSYQKMGHALSHNSGHISFLKEMLEWLDKVEVRSKSKIFCLSGWKLSIHSLLMLWDDLSQNYNLSFLCTRKLNQDCIENLFSRIGGHSSRVDNPSAMNFRSFFRNVMVDFLFVHSKGSNCKEDEETFLLSFRTLMSSMKDIDDSLFV